jgi:hypothetical protein
MRKNYIYKGRHKGFVPRSVSLAFFFSVWAVDFLLSWTKMRQALLAILPNCICKIMLPRWSEKCYSVSFNVSTMKPCNISLYLNSSQYTCIEIKLLFALQSIQHIGRGLKCGKINKPLRSQKLVPSLKQKGGKMLEARREMKASVVKVRWAVHFVGLRVHHHRNIQQQHQLASY